jgi:hypothetical protein
LTQPQRIVHDHTRMLRFSSAEAAKKLGLSPSGLSKHLRLGKLPAPEAVKTGAFVVHSWTEADIERARKLLPQIKNGRKTRHKKEGLKAGSSKPEKPKTKKKQKTPPRAAVPHKQSQTREK